MTSTSFDFEAPVERVGMTDIRRGLLTAIAAVLFGIGWFLAKDMIALVTVLAVSLASLGYAAAWSAAAVRIGWQEGQKSAAARESRTVA